MTGRRVDRDTSRQGSLLPQGVGPGPGPRRRRSVGEAVIHLLPTVEGRGKDPKGQKMAFVIKKTLRNHFTLGVLSPASSSCVGSSKSLWFGRYSARGSGLRPAPATGARVVPGARAGTVAPSDSGQKCGVSLPSVWGRRNDRPKKQVVAQIF